MGEEGAGTLKGSLSSSFHSPTSASSPSGSTPSLFDEDFSIDHFLVMAVRVAPGEFYGLAVLGVDWGRGVWVCERARSSLSGEMGCMVLRGEGGVCWLLVLLCF